MSEETNGSKRCCNRRGCPYYQQQSTTLTTRQRTVTTPFMSANDGTSTQFLYFGPNFMGSPSGGEIREFHDCLSDTEAPIRAVPSMAQSLHQAVSVLSRSDSGNYEMMLQQIIAISQRLLNRLAKGDPRYMRNDGLGGDDEQQQQQALGGTSGLSAGIYLAANEMPGMMAPDANSIQINRAQGAGANVGQQQQQQQQPQQVMGGGVSAAGTTGGLNIPSMSVDMSGLGKYGYNAGTYNDTSVMDERTNEPCAVRPERMNPECSIITSMVALNGASRMNGPYNSPFGVSNANNQMTQTPTAANMGGGGGATIHYPSSFGTKNNSLEREREQQQREQEQQQRECEQQQQRERVQQQQQRGQQQQQQPQQDPNSGTVSRLGDAGRDDGPGAVAPLNGNMPTQHIPIDMRMLRIEPLQLTIPFTLHFKTCMPPECDEARLLPEANLDQRSLAHMGNIEPIRTATFSRPSPPYPEPSPLMPPQQYGAESQFFNIQLYAPPQIYAFAPPQPYPVQQEAPVQQLAPPEQEQQQQLQPPPYVEQQQPLYGEQPQQQPPYIEQQPQQQPDFQSAPQYMPPPQQQVFQPSQTYAPQPQPQPYVHGPSPPESGPPVGPDQLHFPYTPDADAQAYASQGKFPPLVGQGSSYANLNAPRQLKDEPLPVEISQDPPFAQQPWVYPQKEQKGMVSETSDYGQQEQSSSAPEELDKAIQTDRPLKIKGESDQRKTKSVKSQTPPPPPPPPLELDTTEATEKYSKADSHGDNPYLIPCVESSEILCPQLQPPIAANYPNEPFCDVKLYQADFNLEEELSAILNSTMADRWEAGEIVHTSEEPNSQNQNLNQYQDKQIQTHPKNFETTAAENELEFRTSQIEKLEEEQAIYAQPPQPLECDDGMPTKIPENMNYPTQYGRSSNATPPTQYLQPIARQTQTTTSVTCYRTEYKTLPNNGADMQPSINVPITCRCVCRQRKSKSRGRKRREPSNSSSRLNSDSSLGVKKTTSFRFCDEDYFSADSDSDLERRGGCGRKLSAKKARSNIRKRKVESSVSVVQLATMSPEQCMMLKVMEQMMTILCRMDAAQRRQHHIEDGSVKTLYQSSRTGEESKSEIAPSDQNILGEDDDNRSRATEAPSALAAGYDGDMEEQRSSRAAPQELCEETPEDVMMPYEAGGNQTPPNNGNGGDLPADGMIVSNSLPILVITFDPETCMPCCCVHKGPLPGPCQSIPVFEIKSCNNVTTTTTQQQPYVKDVAEGEETEDSCIVPGPPCTCDECTCTDDTEARFEVRIHDHTHIIREDGTECGEISEEGIVEITMNGQAELSRLEEECITDEEMRYQTVVCEATQTEECCCYSLAQKPVPKVPRRSVVSMDELQEFCEEIWSHGEDSASPESCPSHSTRKSSKCKTTKSSKQKSNRSSKSKRSSSKGGSGAAAECDCCHCRAERESKQRQAQQQQQQQQQLVQQMPGEVAVLDAEDCKNQLKSIVDSIITDLECMEKVRRRMNEQRNEEIVPKSPPQHARQSFPVTILEVCELGLSSLYVKWVIHDCFGIGGYEIYVDGYLTNRYYNARHEAAVICDIDVTQAHKVCLVAKPKAEKALLGAGDLLDDDCRPPVTPPTWSPSVFLYEPSPEMDYCKRFR